MAKKSEEKETKEKNTKASAKAEPKKAAKADDKPKGVKKTAMDSAGDAVGEMPGVATAGMAAEAAKKVNVENESLTIASPTQQPVPDDISDAEPSLLQHLDPPTVSDPMQPTPVQVTKETPRYGDEDLAEFQKIIDNAREEAMDELRMLRERLDDLNNSDFAEESAVYSMHMAEQGNEAQEKEKTYAQIQRINDYVRKLDEATARINDKTYGVCRECNILIAKQRLMAVPITTLSASWKIRQQCPPDGVDRVGKNI
ncbi:MAG TPA: TraR/DksA C4-type zinc finger protein [Patescibacteria group bacterium]|nr:TraR/DksA C4-type zinc finger protein [Patescibacteria group bacterium]